MALATILEADTHASVRGNSGDHPTILAERGSPIGTKAHRERNQDRVSTQATSLQDQAGIGHSPGSTDRSPTASPTRSSRQRQNNRHEDLLGETTC
ncbi:hypothetical protein A4R35_00140 [Thermogemmatispora tikiterensis]|uniref:Uncharacterized protein n=1 Tax=Thermogemmatispora tikiterensis TaxID=1825093 RepID=A0A328VAY7_9CHLR|nr:hypothetical protein A4R35_00140 [Thermogemmatispora tikiterensis]